MELSPDVGRDCEQVADYLEVEDHGHEYRVCTWHTDSKTHASRLPTRKSSADFPFRSISMKGSFSFPTERPNLPAGMVPLTDKAMAVIAGRLKPGYLFPNRLDASKPMVYSHGHTQVCKRLGFTFRLYDFRHTFGSRMAMAGVDLMTLRELMGHSSITTTQRYCHPTPEHKREAVEKLRQFNEASSKEHSPPFCSIQIHSVVKAAFLLPLEVKKKTAGKNSQPF